LRFCFTNSSFLLRWAFLHISLGRLASSYAFASSPSMLSAWLVWAAPMAMADVFWIAMHTELFPTVQPPPLPPSPTPTPMAPPQLQQQQPQQPLQQPLPPMYYHHQRPFPVAELPSVVGSFEQWAMQQQVAYAVQTQEYYRRLLDWQLSQTHALLYRPQLQQPSTGQ
jgi:hypothetical protein